MGRKLKMFFSIITLTMFFLSSFLIFKMYVSSSFASEIFSNTQATIHSKKIVTKQEYSSPVTSTVTLAAVGDILLHSTVYRDAQTPNGFDFNPMFEPIKPYLQEPDISFANQETILGGTEIGLSTYPRFNSPYEMGDTLKESGIDIVSMANNHTLDRGEIAIKNATSYLEHIGIQYTGSYVSADDKKKIRTISKNNITFSFLAYTYGTNGLPIPNGKDYLVNLIDKEKILKDIEAAQKVSDVVTVSLHFGHEYHQLPNLEQQELSKELIQSGADIILGHHPHVLQPPAWIERKDGTKGFVIYSLGNFLSGQMQDLRSIGAILHLGVEKTSFANKEMIEIKNPKILLTYVTKSGFQNFKIAPLREASNYGVRNGPQLYEQMKNHMSKWIPEIEYIEQ